MKKQTERFAAFVRSTAFQRVLVGLGLLVVVLLIFQAGVLFGYRKASFSFQGGENYYRAIGKEHRGPIPGMMREDFPKANGSIGRIVSVTLPVVVVEDRDGAEKTIRTSEETVVREGKTTVGTSALQTGNYLVVFGSPNEQAEIEAKLIRLLPPPPDRSGTGTDATLPAN